MGISVFTLLSIEPIKFLIDSEFLLRKIRKVLESIQKRASKMVKGLESEMHEEQLSPLFCSAQRRLRGNLNTLLSRFLTGSRGQH